MALGTPVDGGAAYSAAGGTTVTPAYPAGIVAGDVLALIVGMKPSTANGGTLSALTGWTVRDSLTAAGGYGTTLGADTGNTNLWILTKDTVAGNETGNLTVTVGTNNVCWAVIVRIPSSAGTMSYGSADGSRTTAPTLNTPYTVTLTNGATATNFQSGDMALWAMCIPTDVTTPSQFASHTITATGATFGTPGELEEPDSGTGNDIGGYVAYASVTSGSSTAAPTIGATATGTVTNVRGPIVLLRVRETITARTGSMSATETGSDTASFAGDVIVKGSLAATETGSDTLSGSGKVVVSGSLAVTETGSDTFSASGTVSAGGILGSMAATEVGNDTISGTGKVIVSGSLAATETGSDTLSASGKVIVSGSLSATETGDDVFDGQGFISLAPVTGEMSATEVGDDTASVSGNVFVSGSLDAFEIGQDVCLADGTVLVSGALAATEFGEDIYQETGLVIVSGAMSATESGSDTIGGYVVDGYAQLGYVDRGIFGTVPPIAGGSGFMAFGSRAALKLAANRLLNLVTDELVKPTPAVRKVVKKIQEAQTKPTAAKIEAAARLAIQELQAQERAAEFMVQAKALRETIEQLKAIRDNIEDEEEALLLLL